MDVDKVDRRCCNHKVEIGCSIDTVLNYIILILILVLDTNMHNSVLPQFDNLAARMPESKFNIVAETTRLAPVRALIMAMASFSSFKIKVRVQILDYSRFPPSTFSTRVRTYPYRCSAGAHTNPVTTTYRRALSWTTCLHGRARSTTSAYLCAQWQQRETSRAMIMS